MSTEYLNYITLAGLNEEALAKEQGRKVAITKVVIGLGLLSDTKQPQNQTVLLQPKAETACFVKAIDTEHGFYRIEADIPIPDIGYNYFEIGTLTDTGVLYSYARARGDYVAGTADSDGKLTRIRLNFRTDNSELITITQDDSILFTPITDFEAHVVEFNAHCQADNPHPQYLHNDEHATKSQAEAGVSAAHWMSPLRWMQAFKSRLSNSFTGTRTDYAVSERALSDGLGTKSDSSHDHDAKYWKRDETVDNSEKLNGLTSSEFQRVKMWNANNVADSYRTIAFVDGSMLGSVIRLSGKGTTGGTVWTFSCEILVNHAEGIIITGANGNLTEAAIKIYSNRNEDFFIQLKGSVNRPCNLTLTLQSLCGEVITTYSDGYDIPSEYYLTKELQLMVDHTMTTGSFDAKKQLKENGHRVFSPGNLNISDLVTSKSKTIYASLKAISTVNEKISNPNLFINAQFKVNQRGVASWDDITAGAYGWDRFKKISTSIIRQPIESGAYEPNTKYTLSASDGTNKQITSPVSGHWDNTDLNVSNTVSWVKLEKGSEVTFIELEDKAIELIRCQRFYFKQTFVQLLSDYASNKNNYYAVHFPVCMRIVPVVSYVTPTNDYLYEATASWAHFTGGGGNSHGWLEDYIIADAEI
ncbi:phage tail-collar fiber domain-containing protein [Aliivibrio salmonicida]|uniref:phage tail-collar fiber domain-containing protein n=1 Tax=Aliivibrio salmonicida TaxID=40269 RepID=UPI00406C109F